MDYITVAALAVFVATLFLMIKRPRGLRLGYAAGIGAVASLLLGTVSLGQAAQSFLDIWDAALQSSKMQQARQRTALKLWASQSAQDTYFQQPSKKKSTAT